MTYSVIKVNNAESLEKELNIGARMGFVLDKLTMTPKGWYIVIMRKR